ncbi:hypothetical protein C8R47DRAFT_1108729 [Mycena vitilis]|nr:hypothetical protein C8R47DRAFT_1108729 [Mycena vitilis]
MATSEQLDFSPPHLPHERAVEAFEHVAHEIKAAIVASRHDWDKHEPKMWALASQTSDHDLTHFTVKNDLVAVRSAVASYGNILLGKIRIRAIKLDSAEGENDDDKLGFIFVRIHDSPGDGVENSKFHSLFTEEGKDKEGHNNGVYRAIQSNSTPLEFFNE